MSYRCNCGKNFESSQERSAHMPTCVYFDIQKIKYKLLKAEDCCVCLSPSLVHVGYGGTGHAEPVIRKEILTKIIDEMELLWNEKVSAQRLEG